jgi:hypothetical protein
MSAQVAAHLRHEAMVGGVSNTVFNGVIAWLLLKNGAPLAWTGASSFVIDVCATAFLLPFIVALIVIPLQKGKLAKGKLAVIDLGGQSRVQQLVEKMPDSTFANALLFGLAGLCLIAPLTLLAFNLLGVVEVSPLHYAIFKGLWAGLMAAVLVLPMVLVALRPRNAAAIA